MRRYWVLEKMTRQHSQVYPLDQLTRKEQNALISQYDGEIKVMVELSEVEQMLMPLLNCVRQLSDKQLACGQWRVSCSALIGLRKFFDRKQREGHGKSQGAK